jgi:E3 ubiquitin-protein ligase TRIP12
VTSENVREYIDEVLDAILGKGVQLQAKAFREGFSKVFPVSDLQAFSTDELAMLFGNSDEDWGIDSKLHRIQRVSHSYPRSVGRSD